MGPRETLSGSASKRILTFQNYSTPPSPRIHSTMSTSTVSISQFNDGSRQHPSAPVEREVRTVIQDLRDGIIDTNLRFGRKNQWKIDQQKRYISVLLLGELRTDPVAISRRAGVSRGSDRAVNGNNRFRTLLAFVSNKVGIECLSADPADRRQHTYYYNQVPAFELEAPRRRNLVHVLPDAVRMKFDRYPILFTMREGLSEKEEIDWYKELNTSTVVHTEGHLLKAMICDETDPFVNPFLSTFPVIKPVIGEATTDEDDESLGTFLRELVGCSPELSDERDKKEDTLVSLAVIYNLLVNGKPFDRVFQGEFSQEKLAKNVQTMKEIFQRATCSETFRSEWVSPVFRQNFLMRFWSPRYILGPMAWSIATGQPGAADIWVTFLNEATVGSVDTRWLEPLTSKVGKSKEKVTTYEEIWKLMNKH